MSKLSERLREHVLTVDDTTPHEAVLAVLKRCEQIHASASGVTTPARHLVADEILTVIAEAFGITD
jgi:hypothetical protein